MQVSTEFSKLAGTTHLQGAQQCELNSHSERGTISFSLQSPTESGPLEIVLGDWKVLLGSHQISLSSCEGARIVIRPNDKPTKSEWVSLCKLLEKACEPFVASIASKKSKAVDTPRHRKQANKAKAKARAKAAPNHGASLAAWVSVTPKTKSPAKSDEHASEVVHVMGTDSDKTESESELPKLLQAPSPPPKRTRPQPVRRKPRREVLSSSSSDADDSDFSDGGGAENAHREESIRDVKQRAGGRGARGGRAKGQAPKHIKGQQSIHHLFLPGVVPSVVAAQHAANKSPSAASERNPVLDLTATTTNSAPPATLRSAAPTAEEADAALTIVHSADEGAGGSKAKGEGSKGKATTSKTGTTGKGKGSSRNSSQPLPGQTTLSSFATRTPSASVPMTTASTSRPEGSQARGLKNLGNSCYMNAVLAGMMHCPAFLRCMLSLEWSKVSAHATADVGEVVAAVNARATGLMDKRRSAQKLQWEEYLADIGEDKAIRSMRQAHVYLAFRQLLLRRLMTPDCVLKADKLKEAIGGVCDIFLSREQQDAQEFLVFCLDRMETELSQAAAAMTPGILGARRAAEPATRQKRKRNSSSKGGDAATAGSDRRTDSNEKGGAGWQVAAETVRPSTRCFRFHVQEVRTCHGCGHEQTRLQSHSQLSLTFPEAHKAAAIDRLLARQTAKYSEAEDAAMAKQLADKFAAEDSINLLSDDGGPAQRADSAPLAHVNDSVRKSPNPDALGPVDDAPLDFESMLATSNQTAAPSGGSEATSLPAAHLPAVRLSAADQQQQQQFISLLDDDSDDDSVIMAHEVGGESSRASAGSGTAQSPALGQGAVLTDATNDDRADGSSPSSNAAAHPRAESVEPPPPSPPLAETIEVDSDEPGPADGADCGLPVLELKELISDFFRPEPLDVQCEHCQHPSAEVTRAIRSIPRVLILHLGRIAYAELGVFKVHSDVHYPLELRLDDWSTSVVRGPAPVDLTPASEQWMDSKLFRAAAEAEVSRIPQAPPRAQFFTGLSRAPAPAPRPTPRPAAKTVTIGTFRPTARDVLEQARFKPSSSASPTVKSLSTPHRPPARMSTSCSAKPSSTGWEAKASMFGKETTSFKSQIRLQREAQSPQAAEPAWKKQTGQAVIRRLRRPPPSKPRSEDDGSDTPPPRRAVELGGGLKGGGHPNADTMCSNCCKVLDATATACNMCGHAVSGHAATPATVAGDTPTRAASDSVSTEAAMLGSLFGEADVSGQEAVYDLVSVVNHIGQLATSGHYVADVLGRPEVATLAGGAEPQWFRHDDRMVKPIKREELDGSDRRRQCYLLFYALREGATTPE